jgi:fructokinase
MGARGELATHCVGTGFVALDIIRRALDANTTLERRHAGGSCGNVLAILSYLGMRTTAVGRIGDDPAGTELLADLQRCKVDVKFLAVEQGRRTPVVIQETFFDSRGRPRHRFSRACPACGAMMPGYRPLLAADVVPIASALPSHRCFFFDRVAPGTLELARRSRAQGALVVFEPSGIKDEKLFIDCLRASHVFKYSRERLSGLDELVTQGRPALEIETRGAEGLRFRLRRAGPLSAWTELEALPAPSASDSAGSGDWCTAGFLADMTGARTPGPVRLRSPSAVLRALRFGQALAALNCAYDGARGLTYAMGRAQALKAVERLLANETPRLADLTVLSPAEVKSHGTCTVCTSDLPLPAN